MSTVVRKNWHGWTPNQSEGGGPLGLLRADNLRFDEDGAINISRGVQRISSGAFANVINAIYSRTMGAGTVGVAGSYVKLRYASSNGSVYRNYIGAGGTEIDFAGAILSGGDTGYAAFANAWGHTFVLSGTKKRADKGPSSSWRDLGIPAPTAPGIAVQAPPEVDVITAGSPPFTGGPWTISNGGASTAWERVTGEYDSTAGDTHNGSGDSAYFQLTVNPATLRGIAQAPATGVSTDVWDSTAVGGVTKRDTPNDLFSIYVRFEDTSKLKKFRIEMYMDDIATGIDAKNYFWHEWFPDVATDNSIDYFDPDVYGYTDNIEFIDQVRNDLIPGVSLSTLFREGSNFWSTLQCRRGKFKRVGIDDSLDWNTIKGIRIICIYKEPVADGSSDFYFGNMRFYGGTLGQLNGYYSYKQVNVNNTGEYVEKGIAGTASAEVQVINANVQVSGSATPGNANEVWIYRSSTQTPGYYLVKVLTPGYGSSPSAFIDSLSDIDALRNERLEDYRTALPDGIRYIVGPYYDRLLLFDYRTLYVTHRYDPGSYDARWAMDIAAADNEVILWVIKVIDGEILVGTTNDIYSLRGNLSLDENTGLLDLNVQALGIEQVPVNQAVCIYGTTVIYQAEDGWRTIEGSSTKPLTTAIDSLYKGYDKHGLYGVIRGSRNSSTSSAVVSNGELICSVDHSTIGRALHILDLERNKWRYWRDSASYGDNPLLMFTEEDGVVIYCTTADGDKYLYKFDTGTFLGDGTRLLPYTLRTTYDDFDQPNNRKDLLFLRLKANTGNVLTTVTIRLVDHTNTITSVNKNLQCDGLKEVFLDLASLTVVPKRVQLEFTGLVNTFHLEEYSFEFLSRPEQTNFLRIPPTDLGAIGRKRLPALSMSLDTLGGEVVFVPILDGVAQATSFWLTTDKTVITHQFTVDTIATNIEGSLYSSSQPFEFYGLLPVKDIEVLPDPLKYRFINYTNFGTTKRKRFNQIGIIIDTRGSAVTFKPIIDGVSQPTLSVNTSRKQTVIYYWTTETIGIELAAEISGASEFEYFGFSLEDCIYEVLPVATKYIKLVTSNFGNANKKRVRTWPFEIDTKGSQVTFTPTVDGVETAISTFLTSAKRTVFHYFTDDVFGVDYGGVFSADTEFEFYGSLEPTSVEVLPIGKRFDQLGPFHLLRKGKIRQINLRILPTSSPISYIVYADDVVLYSNSIAVTINREQPVEIILPKGINVELLRVELSAVTEFYRFGTEVKLQTTGSQTEWKWVNL